MPFGHEPTLSENEPTLRVWAAFGDACVRPLGRCCEHPSPLRGSTRLYRAQRPCRYANAMLMVEPRASVAAIIPALRRQENALLEQIELGTAKHLAFEHLQAVNLALHRAGTPGQGDPGFDGLIVIADPLRTPLQGCEGNLRRPGQPGIQLLRRALAHELGKVLGSGDGGSHRGMLGSQLGELGGLVLVLPLGSPEHQPGRPAGGKVAD